MSVSEKELNELKQAIMELTVNMKHMHTTQAQMAEDIKSIKEAIYNPEVGLYARLRDVEQWQDNMSKIIWSVGLGVAALITKALVDMLIL